jgi:hypothetical protein
MFGCLFCLSTILFCGTNCQHMRLRNICNIVKKITSIWSQGVTPIHTTRCGVAPFAMIGGVALLEFLNSLNLEVLN